MIRKNTAIVLVLFLLLVAAAVFLNRNPLPSAGETTPTPTEQVRLLPEISAQDIVWIAAQPAEGEAVRFEQDADGNWIAGGEDGTASPSPGKVEQARDELAAALVSATLPAGYDLAALGLDPAQTEISFGNGAGTQHVLLAGIETPTRSGVYVQFDGGAPVVINSAVIDTVITLLTESAPSPVEETPTAVEPTESP